MRIAVKSARSVSKLVAGVGLGDARAGGAGAVSLVAAGRGRDAIGVEVKQQVVLEPHRMVGRP